MGIMVSDIVYQRQNSNTEFMENGFSDVTVEVERFGVEIRGLELTWRYKCNICIGKNRGSRLSKFEGSGQVLVQVHHKRRECTKRLEEIGE